jgi:cytochrome c-type biogenesis protein CcmH/NrfF
MALVVVGVALWRVPVAIVVAGMLMIVVAELRSLHGTDR